MDNLSSTTRNDTPNSPLLESWVESANLCDCDFPIQNLPFGRYRKNKGEAWRIGVAIGNQVLGLRDTGIINHDDMARLLCLSQLERAHLREQLSQGLRRGSLNRLRFEKALIAQADVEMGTPCDIRDYTDFYVGIHHANAVGRQFRPDQPLLPNYKWVPIAYHGRASTIIPSGTGFIRPLGQVRPADSHAPEVVATRRLDFELEIGVVIGRPNDIGNQIPIDAAEEHIFGLTLFNDWSARDIQTWEYQPLGPFQSKNFASTISPWMVTLEALEPYRTAWSRCPEDPAPLPYLSSDRNSERGAFSISLQVILQTARMAADGYAGDQISNSQFEEAAYWTIAQQVTHHTLNGCALGSGDLLGTGTLSGRDPSHAGSLLELTQGGKRPLNLSNGESRTFLEDGDTVVLTAYCARPGFRRIGLGECRGTVLSR